MYGENGNRKDVIKFFICCYGVIENKFMYIVGKAILKLSVYNVYSKEKKNDRCINWTTYKILKRKK